jgi:hypothetical protein
MALWNDILDPGDVFGFGQDERVSRANAALAKAQEKAEENSNANRGLYGQYYNKMQNTYGDTAGKFNDYLSNLEGMEAYDPGQFSFNGDVNDYYSKFANQRQKQAMNALRESSDIFGSDYMDAMAAKQQALASEEWDKAYNRYMQDRQQSANEWQMNTNAGQNAYNNQYNKNKDLLSVAQGAQDNLSNAYGNYINNLANQNNIDTQNYANYVQQQAANENSKKGLFGRIFG